MYVIELVFTAITYLEQRNMDEPRKAAKPARGQLNWEIKSPCRCIRGKYIDYICIAVCFLFIYQVYFYLVTCVFVHGSLLYLHICVSTAVCITVYIYVHHISTG